MITVMPHHPPTVNQDAAIMVYAKVIKPTVDRLAAAVLLVLLLPVLLVGIVLASIAARGNPFFFHQRPGLHGQPFYLWKLRSMLPPTDRHGEPLTNMQRMTPLGRWLRATSIDELPQLVNVLKGDISLVGPRPLEMRYLPHYSAEQARRHDVKPGITGLAQVSGRNKLTWEQKFELDVRYVDNLSITMDLSILWKTLGRVFKPGDVNSSQNSTMDPFA